MKKKISLLILLFLILIFPLKISAQEKEINIYLFWGDGCPHCKAEEKFFNEYLKDKTNIKLYKYEVWNSAKNREYLKDVQDKLNNKSSGVPYTIIGKNVVVGFSEESTEKTIKKYIDTALNDKQYKDYVGDIVGVKTKYNTTESLNDSTKSQKIISTEEKVEEIDVPVLGKINPKTVSLPLLTIVLGFVDGFNPCAMWILLFLITMLFNMKNRKKMFILGMIFILTSGLVYLAFMLTWLNLAFFINSLIYIRLLIAMVAIIVGIWNLVKYSNSILKKDEGCDVVSNQDRKKIMDKIKNIVSEKKFILAVFGIMALAASVNIIELMCSIGIPLIFTQILSLNNLSSVQYGLYMLLYILFFLIDDIVVFMIAMFTSKITAISTKYTKYSHLISGILMLIIGVLLILKPELLMIGN